MSELFQNAAHEIMGEVVRTAQELIRIKSYSCDESAIADYLADKMTALGYDSVERDACGNVYGTIHGTGNGKSVALNCHMDTVPAQPDAAWPYPPFSGELADGRIWGRGASDTKGAMAVYLYSPVLLRKLNLLPAGDVVCTFVVAEEIAGFGSMTQCQERYKLTDYCILGEATENDLAIANRGRLCVAVTLTGRSCHASIPHVGVNPFDLLPELLTALKKVPLAEDDLLGASTMTVTKIESSEPNTNTVPDRVTVYCDYRQSGDDTEEAIRAKIQAALDSLPASPVSASFDIVYFPLKTYTGLEAMGFQGEHLFRADENDEYVLRCKAALETEVGHEVRVKPWGFATDAGHYVRAGVRAIGYAPAELSLCHSANDSISVDAMEESVRGTMVLIRALATEE